MSDYLVGVDIGFSKICAAAGKLDKYGKMQIIGITSAKSNGLKKSVVIDIDGMAKSIKDCIDQLKTMIDIDINDVYISLPGQVSELIYNKGVVAISSDSKEIKEKDVTRALNSAKLINVSSDKEIVGVIPLQYIVDGYESIKDPVGMNGSRLEVESQVIITSSTILGNLLKSLNRAGLNISGIVLQPLAILGTVFNKEEMNLNNVLIDVGAESSNISIFKHGILQKSFSIALGGNNITNDISLCLKLPYLESEELKIKYGDLNSCDDENSKKINTQYKSTIEINEVMLNKIIKARVEEILLLIKENLLKLSNYEEISEIALVGGGIALLSGIEKMAKEIFGKPVKIGSPNFTGANSPVYATVVGIVQDVAYSLQDSKEEIKVKEIEEDYRSNNNSKKAKTNSNGKNKKFFSKIREFLTDFF